MFPASRDAFSAAVPFRRPQDGHREEPQPRLVVLRVGLRVAGARHGGRLARGHHLCRKRRGQGSR